MGLHPLVPIRCLSRTAAAAAMGVSETMDGVVVVVVVVEAGTEVKVVAEARIELTALEF